MAINRERVRQYLKAFDFRKLFIEELGWDNLSIKLVKQIDGQDYRFQAVAEKRGVVVLVSDSIPEYAIRVKLDKLIAKDHFEHLIVFTDRERGRQVWQWVRKEPGKPTAVRTYHYSLVQAGELLLQKLDNLAFTLDEEEVLTLGTVTRRLTTLDVEKVTKKFYERFKTEHATFLNFIKGIPDKQMESWYASIMVNRLMFLYFIQEKGFLNGDKDYLRNKLAESRDRKTDCYYKEFLCPLFFQGFARKKTERSAAINELLGEIPYLNGGLFQPHQIEEIHGKRIQIADAAFQKLFDFFKEWNWHLDERESREGNEINPDVLGYIFEKYINQKQMGAYYTKEDITEYIAQNTIIPFLLDEARKGCAVAFAPDGSVWRLLRDDPDRYIHDAMKKGANLQLPPEIETGLADVSQRTGWNRTAPEEFGLPTEIWREAIVRHQRYRAIKASLAKGEVHEVNDLVALNLNIRQFAQDTIQFCEGPELLRAIWKAIEKVSVLDPTCGSGAFLFAALNILKPLYEACLTRMQGFLEDLEKTGPHPRNKYERFIKVLTESRRHPNQDYFILKAIIVNNLFGVDIMEEAVEICKLRLFLKLVAQVESQDRIEPLPDIDFNIRAGNTLVGYAKHDDVKKAADSRFSFGDDAMSRIDDRLKTLDSAVAMFRLQQTELAGSVTTDDKAALNKLYRELQSELDDFLAAEAGVKTTGMEKWKKGTRPFHWFCDFHSIMQSGGFDVIIGNPPYVEYRRSQVEYAIAKYETIDSANLWAFVLERSINLLAQFGYSCLIVPLSLISAERMLPSYRYVTQHASRLELLALSGDAHPSVLFDGVKMSYTIVALRNGDGTQSAVFSSKLYRWLVAERTTLFKTVSYQRTPQLGTYHRKIGSLVHQSVLCKLSACELPIGHHVVPANGSPILYHRIVRHFVKSVLETPYFSNERDGQKKSEDYKELLLDTEIHAKVVRAVLISSTFYIYFLSLSDSYHLGKDLILRFPADLPALAKSYAIELTALGARHEADLRKNAVRRRIRYQATGWIEYDEFYPRRSKGICDEVDSVLARHYGFTDEELDFIINYDIKYRLGAGADEDEK
jgi:hypothetical protein